MGKKQLTELEQAMADRAAAYRTLGTKQAALSKAHDAERQAKAEADKADKRVRDLLTAEADQAERAAKAAVGQTTAPRRPATRRTEGAQQQLAGAENNGHQVGV
jgi:hypothetical protein